jgi:hypothetical protein
MALCERNLLDANLIIHADNTSVIDAYKKGRSRNTSRNSSIRRITEMLIPRNLAITPCYVPTELNLADPFSRGEFGSPTLRLNFPFPLKDELATFIVQCTGISASVLPFSLLDLSLG